MGEHSSDAYCKSQADIFKSCWTFKDWKSLFTVKFCCVKPSVRRKGKFFSCFWTLNSLSSFTLDPIYSVVSSLVLSNALSERTIARYFWHLKAAMLKRLLATTKDVWCPISPSMAEFSASYFSLFTEAAVTADFVALVAMWWLREAPRSVLPLLRD